MGLALLAVKMVLRKGNVVRNDKGNVYVSPERVMCEAIKKMPSEWD
jgi:hypothetical protein